MYVFDIPWLIYPFTSFIGSTGTVTTTSTAITWSSFLTTNTTASQSTQFSTGSTVSQFNTVSTTTTVFTLSSPAQASFATSTAKPLFTAMPTASPTFAASGRRAPRRARMSSKGSSGLNATSNVPLTDYRERGGTRLAFPPTVEEEEEQKQQQISVKSKSTSQAFQTGTGQKVTPSSFLFTAKPGGFTLKKEAKDVNVSPKKRENEEDEADPEKEEEIRVKPLVSLETLESTPTGEKNEEAMFCEKGKLFCFDNGQWKERGAGEMKILLNRYTRKWRCVMRRDQTHIVCCNFLLVAGMSLSPYKTSNVVFKFSANDYSDGESNHSMFALYFKTEEIAKRFKAMFDRGCSGETR